MSCFVFVHDLLPELRQTVVQMKFGSAGAALTQRRSRQIIRSGSNVRCDPQEFQWRVVGVLSVIRWIVKQHGAMEKIKVIRFLIQSHAHHVARNHIHVNIVFLDSGSDCRAPDGVGSFSIGG
ncbi:hypothetical protein HUU40_27780 [candidate division KSB1 bacterium]|nr:hypothetical protein [candidate division KSB1 bacterium]